MLPSPCPDPQRLAAYRRGELADETAAQIADHVSSCSTCQNQLAEWEATPLPAEATTVVVDDSPLAPPSYELLDEVGHGGMGVVYCARDLRLNREVAVKLLSSKYAADSASATRFKAEARITGQLQHPGIPPVHELGTLPDGRPFLAMKLIKGRTLHDLLGERADLASPDRQVGGADRGRFIAIFEQLCHAVGYAHTHRVIHRDLKPSNVMVGSHGEVQVMDWGLAKLLDPSRERERPEDEDDPLATVAHVTAIETPERGDSATRTGSVLGTPAYMAPEQAAGQIRQLDARSDVFGLGAILCQILTGHPPYEGREDHDRRVQAVRWETAEAFARLDSCGAEPDLIGLCKRCLAFKQEDRPADGNAVAAEVGRIRQAAEERARRAELERAEALVREAEQRKRRRLTLIAAGAVAAVLLLGLAVSLWQMKRAIDAEQQARLNEQQALANERKAEEERDAKDRALRAETRALEAKTAALQAEQKARAAERQARQQAMTALRFLTDDLVERQLARGTHLNEQDKAYLRQVIKHFEGFAAITADDAESRAIRAEGHRRVADMRHRLGELKEAEESYRAALALSKQLVADFPTVPEYLQELAVIHNDLGELFHTTSRPREAEMEFRTALVHYERLAVEFPTNPRYRQGQALSHSNLSVVLAETDRSQEAEVECRAALAIRNQLVAQFPAVPEYRQELAQSKNCLAMLLEEAGRLNEAEAEHRAALAIRKQLVADNPNVPAFRQDLARSHNNLGVLVNRARRPNDAEAEYRAALALRKQLAADFPTVPAYRQELAITHLNLGVLLRMTGRPKEAEAEFRAAQTLYKKLAADFPAVSDYANELATVLGSLATLNIARKDFAAARALLMEARPHHEAALKANPNYPVYRQFFRDSRILVCETVLRLGAIPFNSRS